MVYRWWKEDSSRLPKKKRKKKKKKLMLQSHPSFCRDDDATRGRFYARLPTVVSRRRRGPVRVLRLVRKAELNVYNNKARSRNDGKACEQTSLNEPTGFYARRTACKKNAADPRSPHLAMAIWSMCNISWIEFFFILTPWVWKLEFRTKCLIDIFFCTARDEILRSKQVFCIVEFFHK